MSSDNGSTPPPEARLRVLEWQAEDRAHDAEKAHDDIVTLVKLQRDQAAEQEKRWEQTQAWFGVFADQLYKTRLTLWFVALVYAIATMVGKMLP